MTKDSNTYAEGKKNIANSRSISNKKIQNIIEQNEGVCTGFLTKVKNKRNTMHFMKS